MFFLVDIEDFDEGSSCEWIVSCWMLKTGLWRDKTPTMQLRVYKESGTVFCFCFVMDNLVGFALNNVFFFTGDDMPMMTLAIYFVLYC